MTMRPPVLRVLATLAACLALAAAPAAAGSQKSSNEDPNATAKSKMKARDAARPARATGVGTATAATGDGGGMRTNTISTFRTANGETVYSVSPSRFDISPPLRDLAAQAPAMFQEESEAPENPQLPPWRQIHSDIPDPVVQVAPSAESHGLGGSPLAPSTGFNFVGVGILGGTPSDSNGSVGATQFVEIVNTRYQVWALNRTTHVATSVLGPTNINALWSGFGGPCQTENSGDPIALYDKVAGRWLISQFTTGISGGFYYQCVAVSTTSDATGTFARYAFAVPNGYFGDYPHFGVWTDAYYMMAHEFTSTSGSYVGAIFAAMDRTKILANDPTATWQVIVDTTEGGHMPADLDGFAPPPTGAPGIFVSVHSTGMYVYRMKVDFTTPANTVRTRQATMPIAPATGACNGGGSCIPQPGTGQVVDSLGDRLMFRAAYRNFVDHESLTIVHSVDPSVSGVVSGVRWYDFRLSGSPNATCATYPCTYQQGTIADVANGRSRWMGSIAMDGAENMLVGYSTTGMTAGTENQSIRYTGRAKNDPPGTMTAPETVIFVGTANNTNSRWGDYSSMAVDPTDDCTFFYTNQYFMSAGNWSTRVASASWPAGSGAGQCAASSCTSRPTAAPTLNNVTVPGQNQLKVTWTGLLTTPGSYAIERADGACGSEGLYRPLGFVPGTTTNYTDTTVLGGLTYSYRVIAATDTAGRCQAAVVSGCLSQTATGTCNLKPSFAGATSASSAAASTCGVTVSWTPAAAACPLTPNMKYNLFRGTTPDFVPSLSNRIATCVPGPSSYTDHDNLSNGITYYYVVRSEDSSTGNGGECSGGNEDANSIAVAGTAYGAGFQPSPGTWTDGGGDGTAFLRLNVAGAGDTADQSWRIVKTADDSGANHTPGGSYAYRNAGPGPNATYTANTCSEMQSPPLTIETPTSNLEYWERHDIEYHWDAIAVEYAVNGGPWNDVAPPSNAAGDGCAATDDTSGWQPLECTQAPPINGCGYPTTKLAYNGPLASGTTCNDYSTATTPTDYAHRCHLISGLNAGDSVQFRWRFSSDPGAQYAGFYLDDIAVTGVQLPNACVPDTCAGKPDGTGCNDGNACTQSDACSGGSCSGIPLPTPGEIAGVTVNGHSGTTIAWTGAGSGIVYDVASSTLSDLRVNGPNGATCLANDVATTSTVDARPDPAAGDGYYYIVRGQTSCATGTYGFTSAGPERIPTSGCP